MTSGAGAIKAGFVAGALAARMTSARAWASGRRGSSKATDHAVSRSPRSIAASSHLIDKPLIGTERMFACGAAACQWRPSTRWRGSPRPPARPPKPRSALTRSRDPSQAKRLATPPSSWSRSRAQAELREIGGPNGALRLRSHSGTKVRATGPGGTLRAC